MISDSIRLLSYGMYIVSSRIDDKLNGQIVNTAFQITSNPPVIAVSINKKNLTHECIEKSRAFSVSILSENAPMTFLGLFGFRTGRNIDKFKDIRFKIGESKSPIVIEYSVAYLDVLLANSVDAGSHTLFIGKAVGGEKINSEIPMTYVCYKDNKKGKAPENAPTYIKENNEIKQGVGEMTKYKCTVCGYIYDPEKGDPDSGIKPGTSFEQLPAGWVCPVCGVGKDQFTKEG